jgi:hypothetical protein
MRSSVPALAEVAGLPDGLVRVADDLPGAQLHQADGGLRYRTVRGGLEHGPGDFSQLGDEQVGVGQARPEVVLAGRHGRGHYEIFPSQSQAVFLVSQ